MKYLIILFLLTIWNVEWIYCQQYPRYYPNNYANREGSCSPQLAVQVCYNTCNQDYDCSSNEKCCDTSCGGKVCSTPISQAKDIDKVKSGLCPLVPQGPWFCSSTCRFDSDCQGSKKCCRNKCGAMGCYKPIATV